MVSLNVRLTGEKTEKNSTTVSLICRRLWEGIFHEYVETGIQKFQRKSEKLSFAHGIIGIHSFDFSEFSKCD